MTLACCIARGAIQVYLLSKPTLWPYLAKKKKKKNRILIASLATAQLMFPSQDISVDSVRAELFPPNTVALPPPTSGSEFPNTRNDLHVKNLFREVLVLNTSGC